MRSSKRILFTCNPYWIGGPITWLQRATQYLPEQNWECKVILPGTARPYHAQWSDWPGTLEWLEPAYSGPSLVHALADAILRFEPDVLVGVALDCAPNAVRLLRRSGRAVLRYLDTLHNDNDVECERLRPHADVIDAVAVCSDRCGERVRTQIPELARHVVRFWYPAPCDEHFRRERYSSGPLRLILMARLHQYPKRVLDLVPLCRRLSAANVDFRLIVVGDGPERTQMETGIRSIPAIGDRVEFTGWLSNSEALEILRQQHVLLLLSEFEGQPIVILEGAGCGVVAVVTDIPAHQEIINPGQDGFLVQIGNIDDFIATLQLLAANRKRLAEAAQAAWLKACSTWHHRVAISRFANVLDGLLQKPLLGKDRIADLSYPASRMTDLGVPHAVQGFKRRLLRQPVVF